MKRKMILCAAILISFVFIGCAAYRPIVDQRSIGNQAQYEADLAECQAYAAQIDPGANVAAGAIGGAAVGAVLGLVVAAFFGVDAGSLAGFGAAIGGMDGAAQGAGHAAITQRDIIRRCMIGRGYQVLH